MKGVMTPKEQAEKIVRDGIEHPYRRMIESITEALAEKDREIERLKTACTKESESVEKLTNQNAILTRSNHDCLAAYRNLLNDYQKLKSTK